MLLLRCTRAGSAADDVFSLNTSAADGYNPYVTSNADNQLADQLVYENIFNVDDDYNLTSRIITSYEDTDGTYWYFSGTNSLEIADSNFKTDQIKYNWA